MKLFDALVSPILFYASEVRGIDCNGKLEKDPAEIPKVLLGVDKYCNNNACRAETGRFPMSIDAQCRNFKFWLTLTKNKYKLSQIAYNDIKWKENKALWSKKNQRLIGTDRIRRPLDESTLCRHRNCKHYQATTQGYRTTKMAK